MVKKVTKKGKKTTAPMHDMGGGHMMKDSEMGMSQDLKARYPSMVKKASPKRKK